MFIRPTHNTNLFIRLTHNTNLFIGLTHITNSLPILYLHVDFLSCPVLHLTPNNVSERIIQKYHYETALHLAVANGEEAIVDELSR